MWRLALKIVAGLATVAAAVAGLLVWRLWQGPIRLDFLTPRIEEAVRAADPDLSVEIESTELIWDTVRWRPDFAATGVRLVTADGVDVVTLPLVALRPNLRALLEGRLALAGVELVSPQLDLVRRADGSIGISIAGTPSPAWFAPLALPDPPPVRRIGVRDGVVTLHDEPTGRQWRAQAIEASLRLDGGSASLEAQLETDLQPFVGAKPAPARVELRAKLPPGAGAVELESVKVQLDDIELEAHGRVTWLAAEPELELDASVAALPTAAVGRYWPPDLAAEARSWVTTNITGGRLRDVSLRLTAKQSPGGGLALGEVGGRATLDGLSVRFLDTMPPATGIAGTASLTAAGAQFDVSQARVSSLQVSAAKVSLPIGDPPRITIAAKVAGDAAAAFAVLDHPPVGLAKALGFSPRAGTVAGDVRFAFPLRDGLGLRDLGLGVSAKLSRVDIEHAVGDWSLTATDATVGLDGSRLKVSGNGLLQGVPLRFDHGEDLLAPGSRRLSAKAAIDQRGREALGLDPGHWLGGTVQVDAEIMPSGGGDAVRASLDLADAEISLPRPALHKARGAPGRAKATLQIRQGQVASVEGFEATYSGSDVAGRAARSGRGPWSVSAQADLAALPGSGRGRATLEVDPAGGFTMRSPDVAALLASFGRDFGEGGKLEAKGEIDLARGLPLEARLEVDGLQIQDAPVLTRVLRLASFRGAFGSLTGEALRFQTITALVVQKDGIVSVRDGAARAQSFALVVRGTLDLGQSTVDANGSVIPSYFGVNEGLGKIPLLGSLLTGGKEKAIQAIDFQAKGPVADPKVSVNSLSSLTPRALSDLFHRLQSGILPR